ncbi:hypothetical protein LZ30DRAFT_440565 [Colletotrichum cereale]|nr:hypothetical protein LZ30DRAFT_440565 [Colletotrichum cereale]
MGPSITATAYSAMGLARLAMTDRFRHPTGIVSNPGGKQCVSLLPRAERAWPGSCWMHWHVFVIVCWREYCVANESPPCLSRLVLTAWEARLNPYFPVVCVPLHLDKAVADERPVLVSVIGGPAVERPLCRAHAPLAEMADMADMAEKSCEFSTLAHRISTNHLSEPPSHSIVGTTVNV